MVDFLERLANRAMGLLPTVELLRPSRFAPSPALADQAQEFPEATGAGFAGQGKQSDWDAGEPLVYPQSTLQSQTTSAEPGTDDPVRTHPQVGEASAPLSGVAKGKEGINSSDWPPARTEVSAGRECPTEDNQPSWEGDRAPAIQPAALRQQLFRKKEWREAGSLSSRARPRSEKDRGEPWRAGSVGQHTQRGTPHQLKTSPASDDSVSSKPRAGRTPLRPLVRPFQKTQEDASPENERQEPFLEKHELFQRPEPEPAVRIQIGRIEVRAVPSAETGERRRASPPTPTLTLEDYLRQRNRGER